MIKNIKEKAVSATGSISGVASILGSWQVCHNVCLGIIALLSVIGITLVGMPLAFLTAIAVPLWSIALAMLILTIYLYKKKKCISKNLIIINSGLLTAGIPFQSLERLRIIFWIVGGLIILYGLVNHFKNRKKKSKHNYFAYFSIIAIVILSIFIFAPKEVAIVEQEVNAKQEINFESITTGSADAGNVEVTLKPSKVSQDEIIFDLSMNTHSVELSELDFGSIAILKNNGKDYMPVDALKPSGHHSSGIIRFVGTFSTEEFEVIITGIPSENTRVFSWK